MIEEKRENRGEQPEEQVNIQEILFRYLIHWPWFVVSVIICIACAWGYLRLTTPVYNISATVLIKDDKKGGGASMSSELEKMGLDGFVSSSNNVDNEIEVLKSKSLAREVVNNLGLFVTYKDEDEFPSRELYRTSPVVVSLTPQEADKIVCTNGSGDDFISQWWDGCVDNSERQRVSETIRTITCCFSDR